MSTQYLYRVNILSKRNEYPLNAIANICGEDQFDLISKKVFKSDNSDKVIWNQLIIPEKESENYNDLPQFLKIKNKKPEILSNARNILWSDVDYRENRIDSQFARVFEVSIPYFLTQLESVDLISKFANTLIEDGMICDVAIHSHYKKNITLDFLSQLKIVDDVTPKEKEEIIHQDYSGFVMCTLRDYSNGIFQNKNRNWNSLEKMKAWRYEWTKLLFNSINNSEEASENQKKQWLKKLSIYPEYKQISKKNKTIKI